MAYCVLFLSLRLSFVILFCFAFCYFVAAESFAVLAPANSTLLDTCGTLTDSVFAERLAHAAFLANYFPARRSFFPLFIQIVNQAILKIFYLTISTGAIFSRSFLILEASPTTMTTILSASIVLLARSTHWAAVVFAIDSSRRSR